MRQDVVDSLRRHRNAGKTKAEAVRQIAAEFPDLERKEALPSFREGLEMSAVAASTYFYKYTEKNRLNLENTAANNSITEVETSTLRQSLESSATQAAIWYQERTTLIEREVFLKRRGVKDSGKGAVYSYHTEESTLYVGITGYRVKSRLTTPTSPHREKDWWSAWTHMRFLPLASRSERETLEHLLILGLMPEYNRKPGYIDFETFLDQHK